MRRIGRLAALVMAPSVALSAATGAGFLNVPLSAQQVGMGEVSVGGGDVSRAWSNPSLLSAQSTRGEIGLSGGSYFDGGHSGMGACAGWLLGSRWSVGLGFSSESVSFSEVDAFGDPVGTSVAQSQMAIVAMGAVRTGPASIGIAVKSISDTTAKNSASAVGADAGVSVELDGFLAGAAVRNLGAGLRTATAGAEGGESLPMEVRGGVAYRIAPMGLLAGVEYATADTVGRIGLGAEWWINKMFAVRAGVAGLGAVNGQRITAGLSARLAGIGVDYAAATHVLGLTHQVGVSYGFGGPAPVPVVTAAEAPVEEEVAATPEPAPVPVPVVAAAPVPAKRTSGLLNMAVSELISQGVSASDSAVISDMLRAELVKTKRFNIIEKANMDKILAEQAFQQSGCTSEECAVKLGKLLNVHRMIVGSFGKLMDKYFVSLRVVNVETGAVLFADSAKGRTVEDIETGIQQLARKIGKEVR
ncbi:MAG: CsgG/HfaB family protein [Candidatus Coatesbacteria bacterium]